MAPDSDDEAGSPEAGREALEAAASGGVSGTVVGSRLRYNRIAI